MKPEIWRLDPGNWAHVYPSGDTYYKDHYSTRSCRMYGSYSEAVRVLTMLGYKREG